ncbi:MAG: hypothetical protein HY344_04365 [Candidatus Levybacteria bacterium]|nr:hypothetical protein [Candidatus Levybacteria bacterium]
MKYLQIFANICLVLALYYLIYYVYLGIVSPIPQAGDSFDYHIPIAKSILDGSFLSGLGFTKYQHFYPGTSEIINSLFILLNIPLTLSNIIPSVLLGISCFILGRVYRLDKYSAIIFASSIFTLNAILRWMNAVSVDAWIGVYFVLALILLKNPNKTVLYFLKLGVVFGLLIGTKYSAVLLSLVLLVFYFKDLIKVLNLRNLISFLIPFSALGLFWYFRNFLIMGNPFYPVPILGFPGKDVFNGTTMLKATINYPIDMFNAAFSEYKLWFLTVIAAPILLYKKRVEGEIGKLLLLGIVSFIIFLFFPTDNHTWVMVSSFRYSYFVFVPLILGVFLYFNSLRKMKWLSYFAIANMLGVSVITYQPKLILIVIPLALALAWISSWRTGR